jgi:hypothetical protein
LVSGCTLEDRSPDAALRPELQANPAWDRLSSALTGPHHHLLFFEGLAAKPSTPTDWKTIEAMIESKYQDIILQLHVMIVASASRSLPRQGKVLIDPDGSLHRGYYPGTEEAHTNPTRQRGECLRALAGASG